MFFASSINQLLDKAFSIPPVEKRDDIIKIVWPKLKKESDDNYIYYLCVKRSFFIVAPLILLNAASYAFGLKFDLLLFEIDLTGPSYIDDFVWSFPFYTANILLAIVFPFHLAMFRWHFNPKTFDVLWWNPYFAGRKKRTRKRIVLLAVANVGILIGVMYAAFGLPLVLVNNGVLQYTALTLDLTMIFYLVLFPFAPAGLVVAAVMIWRYVGRYEKA